ncbi:MAG: ABC transporter substrate-binding protein [Acidimicrobiales bacterium]
MTDERPRSASHPHTVDRRTFLLGTLAGAGALALAGCSPGSSGSPGGGGSGGRPTLRTANGALGFPTPFASNGGPGYQQMSLIYDTLLWTDGSGTLLPWLAESYTNSEDHLTYTFQTRQGVTWNDGRPFSAEDVAFTYNYYKAQRSLSPPVIIQPPQGIARIVATGPNTVVFTLETPAVTFPAQIAGAVPIIPKHVWETIKEPGLVYDMKALVGTGPYRLDQYNDDGGAMLYTARDDYFLGAPYVQRIQMDPQSDQFATMLAGQCDIARTFGARDDQLAPFLSRPDDYGLITNIGDFVTSQLYWNLAKGGGLGDVRFRRACAMAIDRQELLTRLSSGKGAPGNPGFLSPKNPAFTAVQQYPFDVAGANALLDGAGYRMGAGGIRQGPDGKPLSYEFRYDNVEAVPMSEIVIPALKRIGVELRSKPALIGPELFGPKLFGGFDMAVLPYPGPAPGGPNADPDVLRVMFKTLPKDQPSLTAAGGYDNPVFNALADEQLVTFDPAKRQTIVNRMQKIIADDIPVLSLFYPEIDFVFRKKLNIDWYFTPGEYPTGEENKQAVITGEKSGTKIRATK